MCLAYFGDGASNQGQVYESFNMAELWKLPVIYVIENNQYAMGTSINRCVCPRISSIVAARASASRASRSMAWTCLPARGAAEEALAWVRAGKGPIILEMKTYRYRGHSMSDPAKYRSREEVQAVRDKSDPIEHCQEAARGAEGVKEDEFKKVDQEIRKIVNEAADFAEQYA